MSEDIEQRLRKAYLANGGSESDFDVVKPRLLEDYRRQATINAALEAESPRQQVNDHFRRLARDHGQGRLEKFSLTLANQKGNSDDAA